LAKYGWTGNEAGELKNEGSDFKEAKRVRRIGPMAKAL
jgi:hypothetical protein